MQHLAVSPGDPAGRDLGARPLECGETGVVGHAVGKEVEAEEHEDAGKLGGIDNDQRLHVGGAVVLVAGTKVKGYCKHVQPTWRRWLWCTPPSSPAPYSTHLL